MWSMDVQAGLAPLLEEIDAQFKIGANKSSIAEVTIGRWRLEQIEGIAYRIWLREQASRALQEELQQLETQSDKLLVMRSAIFASDIELRVTANTSSFASASSSIATQLESTSLGHVEIRAASPGVLAIRLAGGAYVAGTFSKYTPARIGAFPSEDPLSRDIAIPPGSTLKLGTTDQQVHHER